MAKRVVLGVVLVAAGVVAGVVGAELWDAWQERDSQSVVAPDASVDETAPDQASEAPTLEDTTDPVESAVPESSPMPTQLPAELDAADPMMTEGADQTTLRQELQELKEELRRLAEEVARRAAEEEAHRRAEEERGRAEEARRRAEEVARREAEDEPMAEEQPMPLEEDPMAEEQPMAVEEDPMAEEPMAEEEFRPVPTTTLDPAVLSAAETLYDQIVDHYRESWAWVDAAAQAANVTFTSKDSSLCGEEARACAAGTWVSISLVTTRVDEPRPWGDMADEVVLHELGHVWNHISTSPEWVSARETFEAHFAECWTREVLSQRVLAEELLVDALVMVTTGVVERWGPSYGGRGIGQHPFSTFGYYRSDFRGCSTESELTPELAELVRDAVGGVR